MNRPAPYAIEVTDEADEHLAGLKAHDRAKVLDSLEPRLAFEPRLETRNRKRLRPNPVAPWELRLGNLRVYFDVDEEPKRVVKVLAVGVKLRDTVRIGGRVVELK